MALINILVAVNASELASRLADGSMKPGSVSSPTNLGAWGGSDVFVSMIAQNSYVASDQGGSELDIKANSGDTVRWLSVLLTETQITQRFYTMAVLTRLPALRL